MTTTRRGFLRAALGAPAFLSLGGGAPAFFARAVAGVADRGADARPAGDDFLVVLQLTGGNDGLNTVIPFADDRYARARPTLRIGADRVLRIDGHLGFHPEMAALRRLWDAGSVAVVQGVGYPDSSRDHQAALRDWETARPGSNGETGWVGRAADRANPPGGTAVPALFSGEIDRPFSLNAERAIVPAVRSAVDLAIPGQAAEDAPSGEEVARLADAPRRSSSPLLDGARAALREAAAASRKVEAVAGALPAAGRGRYPDFGLARHLETVARLVRAGVGIRIFFAELGGGGLGGFDNHANQAANHGALLRQLSESVAAFAEDLRGDGLLDRLLLITFSEFGRTLAENGRRGTDHGAAQPVLAVGVRPGFHGAHPDLDALDGGAPRPHTDFRRVYAAALAWLGLDATAVLGDRFEPIALARG